jgi:hypothetical protein
MTDPRTETPGGGTTPSAPLAGPSGCRLDMVHGAGDFRLRVARDMPDLYRLWHDAPQARVELRGDVLSARFVPDWTDLGRLFRRDAAHVELTLNGSIPWTVRLRGGASTLEADLRDLDLRGLEVQGGANQIDVHVPAPHGVCPILFVGGAAAFGLHRPAGAAARLHVTGGFSTLAFDGRLEARMGGTFTMESSGLSGSADYYDIDVTGGASKLTIDVER